MRQPTTGLRRRLAATVWRGAGSASAALAPGLLNKIAPHKGIVKSSRLAPQ